MLQLSLKKQKIALTISLLATGLFLTACPKPAPGPDLSIMALAGGGGGDGGTTEPVTYSISGTVTGLAGGQTVTLSNNGSDSITVEANGNFQFASKNAALSSYNVQVDSTTAPACTASKNSGTITADITDVKVVCGSAYPLKVTVTDLDAYGGLGSGLVFQNNGGDDLAVAAPGTATFATNVVEGADYSITVKSAPTSPTQACSPVATSTGTMSSPGVTVTFGCSTSFYTINASVTGLAGTGLKLRNNNNAGDELTLVSNTTYSFTTKVANGMPYAVTVQTQPTNLSQTCVVTGGAGNISNSDVTASVTCTTNQFTVGGNVTGLPGGGSVVLQLNGGSNKTVTSSSTAFTFAAQADGSAYAVTILSAPSGYQCVVTGGSGGDGSGTFSGASVTNIAVACASCIGGGSKTLTVSWTASRSYDVGTAAGGGHKIYYDLSSGVSKTTPNVVDVPNSSSTTSGTISNLVSGCKYYVRVGAYSALNSTGNDLTTEQSVTIP